MDPGPPLQLSLGTVDLDRRLLESPAGTVRLSPTEARLLGFLAAHPDREWSPEELLLEVWGYKPGIKSRTVFSTMQRLRAKVEVDPSEPHHILTTDAGYRFVPFGGDAEVVQGFVGRRASMARCLAAIRAREPLVSVTGPGGVGKTRLAQELARQAASHVSTVVVVELEDVDRPAEVLDRLALALQLTGPADTDRLRQALAGRAPAVVVLDDLDRLDDDAPHAVSPLVGVPDVCVVVTARRALGHPSELRVALEPLSPPSSRLLLGQVAAEAGGTSDAHPEEDLDALCEALDHLPLALVLAGPWLAVASARTVRERVGDLSSGTGGRHGSLDACLEASWTQLPASARDDLMRVSLVGPRVPLELAHALIGHDSLPRLRYLHDRSLVTLGDDWVRILGTVRQFASSRATTPLEASVAERWYGWALDQATSFAGIDTPHEVRHLTRVLPQVLTAIDAMGDHPRWPKAAAAVTRLQLTGGLDDGTEARIAKLVRLAEASGDPRQEAEARQLRGLVRSRTGSEPVPDLEYALGLLEPDDPEWGHIALSLAALLRSRRELERAQMLVEQALKAARTHAHRVVEARALVEMGMLHRSREAHSAAVDVLRRAAVLAKRIDHGRLVMVANGARASAERRLGNPVEAETLLRGAIEAAEALSDPENAAHLRGNLANLCIADGRATEAARLCRDARSYYRAHGQIHSEAFVNLTLGICELVRGHPQEASALFLDARDAFAVSRSLLGEAHALANLGRTEHHVGRPAAAIERYRTAIERLGAGRADITVTRLHALLALAWIDAGEPERASEIADRTLHADLEGFPLLIERGLAASDDPVALDAFRAEVRALLGSGDLERDYAF